MSSAQFQWGASEIVTVVVLAFTILPHVSVVLVVGSKEDAAIANLAKSSNPVYKFVAAIDYTMLMSVVFQVIAYGQMDLPSAPVHLLNFTRSFYWACLNFVLQSDTYRIPDELDDYWEDLPGDLSSEGAERLLQGTDAPQTRGLVAYCEFLGIDTDWFFSYVLIGQILLLIVLFVINSLRFLVKHCRYPHPDGVSGLEESSSGNLKPLSSTGHFLATTLSLFMTIIYTFWYPLVLGPLAQLTFHAHRVASKTPALTVLAHLTILGYIALVVVWWRYTTNVDPDHPSSLANKQIFRALGKHYKPDRSYFWLFRIVHISLKAVIVAFFVDVTPTQPILFLVVDLGYMVLGVWMAPHAIHAANLVWNFLGGMNLLTNVLVIFFAVGEPQGALSGLGTFLIVLYVTSFIVFMILLYVRHFGVISNLGYCRISCIRNGTSDESSQAAKPNSRKDPTFNTVAHDVLEELNQT